MTPAEFKELYGPVFFFFGLLTLMGLGWLAWKVWRWFR